MDSEVISVATIGECMLELSRQDSGWKMGHAGDTLNTLWVVRALLPPQSKTDFVSAFGKDPFSDQQINFLRENGIGIASSPRLEAVHPGLYAITLEGAERSFTYWRNQSAARQLAGDPMLLAKSLDGRDLLYFSGITLAILSEDGRASLLSELARARATGSIIAFDPNFRSRLWASQYEARESIALALAHVDIALPTFSDEQELYGDRNPEETSDRLRDAGVLEIVVKNGGEAALVHDSGARLWVPAMRVQPLDTTGAGDSFNGGYLAARLSGYSSVEAASQAHKAAAITVQAFGALAPMDALKSAQE